MSLSQSWPGAKGLLDAVLVVAAEEEVCAEVEQPEEHRGMAHQFRRQGRRLSHRTYEGSEQVLDTLGIAPADLPSHRQHEAACRKHTVHRSPLQVREAKGVYPSFSRFVAAHKILRDFLGISHRTPTWYLATLFASMVF